ncbi:hypothetical protein COY25_04315 [Candidatus Uhrbacteria bacterium CG_4_10_14_0_2_um_filter_41_7]|nr:MAG: hypothetical protein COY25_04315 [Candidatus Uhrbacteria bacterium CG_4_10_14_0_2_um_filter_41_7]
MIYFARIIAGYSITDISQHLQLHRSTVSRIFNRSHR